MWADPRRWSLARQAFAMLVAAVLVITGAALGAAYLQTRGSVTEANREEVLAVARSVAASPTVPAALRTADPSAALQDYAEDVRRATGTDFITVMTPQGIRWTHPNPDLIGQRFLGHTEEARAGRDFTETYTGTLGPSVRAVVPVRDGSREDDGIVALVAVGVTVDAVGAEVQRQVPALLLAALVTVLAGALGAALLSRRLRRQTHGLGPAELRRMYEYYDGVLHAVREGLLLLDGDRRLQLVNDEGRRLLGLDDSALGRPLTELPLPAGLITALARPGARRVDDLQLTDDRVLVVSQAPAEWNGQVVGSVVTLRDHTDLVALSDELSSARSLAESLRSQAHESANRLHSVITMIELGQTDRALEFATAELAEVQELTDRVVAAVHEPVVAALLLGKAAEAAERGVQLTFPGELQVDDGVLPARDLLTVVGNLIDNALDAALDAPPGERRVCVTAARRDDVLHLSVSNTGPPIADPDKIFRRGWSTKTDHGGLGLALVQQAVQRLGGTVTVTGDGETRFDVRLPAGSP